MRIMTLIAAATMLTPTMVAAQSRPVSLEIVASGALDVKPSRVSMVISFKGEGDTQAEAERAVDAKMAKVQEILKAENIPASALGETSVEAFIKAGTDSAESEDPDMASDAAGSGKPKFSVPGVKQLTVTSAAVAEAVKAKLEAIDVTVGSPKFDADEARILTAQREVKALALRSARTDAEVYAKEMGMRINRVVRISEGGSGPLMPGIQTKLQQVITQGPQAFARMFKRTDGSVTVETSIVVEFELTK